jgi:hypothetical protein
MRQRLSSFFTPINLLFALTFLFFTFPRLRCLAQEQKPGNAENALALIFNVTHSETILTLESTPTTEIPPPPSACGNGNCCSYEQWFQVQIQGLGDLYFFSQNSSVTLALYKEFPDAHTPIWGCAALQPVNTQAIDRKDKDNYVWRQSELVPGQNYWLRVLHSESSGGQSKPSLHIQYSPDERPAKKQKNKTSLLPFNDPNHTCDKAICIVRGVGYTNRDRPYCYPCTGIWAPPEVTCGGASSWGLMDNPVFFKFEVLPTTPQPVSVSLNVDFCDGGSSTLQMGIWSAARCPGGGRNGFFRCADGVGNLTVTENLPVGNYFLVVDGGRGAECDWRFESNISLSAVSNSPVCAGETIELTVPQAAEGSKFIWVGPNNFFSTERNPNIPNASSANAGNYKVQVFPPSGTLCPDTFTTSTAVIVRPITPLDFTVIPPNPCAGQEVLITYNGPQNVSRLDWSFEGGTPNTGRGIGPFRVRFNETGDKRIIVRTPDANCPPSKEVTITVSQPPTPTFTLAGNPVCTGQSATLRFTGNAEPNSIFSWNCGGCAPGNISGAGPHSISWNTPGNKTLSLVVSSNGCRSPQQNVIITVNPTPSASFTINGALCENALAQLNYRGAGNDPQNAYQWNCDGCSPPPNNTTGPFNVSWNTAGTKIITLSVSRLGCIAQTSDSVFINPLPRVNLAISQNTACEQEVVQINGTVSPNAPILSFSWNCQGCQSLPFPGTGSVNVSWATAGNKLISYSITDEKGCTSATATQSILIKPRPIAAFTFRDSLCADQAATLTFTGQTFTPNPLFTWECNDCIGLNGAVTSGPFSLSWESGGNKNLRLQIEEDGCLSATAVSNVNVQFVPISTTSNSPVCENTSLFLTASSAPGSAFQWRGPNNFTSSDAIIVSNAELSLTGVYSVTAISNSCTSRINTVNVQILPFPQALAIRAPTFICAGSNLALSAQTESEGTTFLWNGPAGFTSTLQFPIISGVNQQNTGVYSLVARLGECASPTLTQTVTVQFVPQPTVGQDTVFRCGIGPIAFSVTTPPQSAALLYDLNLNEIARSVQLPHQLNANLSNLGVSVFWVRSLSPEGCFSLPLEIYGKALTIPPTPRSNSVFRCGEGNVNFTILPGSPASKLILLYDTPTGGNRIAQAEQTPFSFSLPGISTSTVFYAEGVGEGGCVSLNRAPISIRVGKIPQISAPSVSRCGMGSVVFSPLTQNTIAVRLFDNPNATDALATSLTEPFTLSTPILTASATFYISAISEDGCESEKIQATALITRPEPPRIANVERCGPGDVTFNAADITQGSVRLYRSPESNELIALATQPPYRLSIDEVSASATFYAELSLGGSCISARVPVIVLIKGPVPASPIITDVIRCGAGAVVLSPQMGNPPGDKMRLFSGTTLLDSVSSPPYQFFIPNVSVQTHYSIEAINTSIGCTSAKTNVLVSIAAVAPRPLVAPVYRCGGGKAIITALVGSATDYQVNLYTTPTGGAPIATDGNAPFELNSPILLQDAELYVSAVNSICGESERTPVSIFVAPVLEVNTNVTPVYNANDGKAQIQVSGGYPPYIYTLNEKIQNENTFSNLAPGAYTLWVRDSRNCIATQEIIIPEQACPTTEILRIQALSSGGYGLNWRSVPEAVQYEFQLRERGGNAWSPPLFTTDTIFILNNLRPESEYEVRIRTLCGSKRSDFAQTGFQTPTCNAINALTLSEVNETSALVNWSAMEGATAYEFSYRLQGSANWQPSEILGATTKVLNNLIRGATYEIKVRTICFRGSVIADFVYNAFTTLSCEPVTNLQISNIGSQTADLQWNSNPYATGYEVGYLLEGASSWVTVITPTNTIALGNLSPNSNYQVRVRPICRFDRSEYRSIAFRTLIIGSTDCPVITDVQITNIGQNSVLLNWNAAAGATGYMLRYRVTGGSWININVTQPYLLSNLSGATTYELQVRTLCNNNFASWSVQQTFRTLAAKSEGELKSILTQPNAQIYPNPNKGNFNVALDAPESGIFTLTLIDVTGKIALEQTSYIDEGRHNFNYRPQNLAPGIYWAMLYYNGNRFFTNRLLIQD